MKKISTLRKAFCASTAFLLMFVALPFALTDKASAAKTCDDGPTDLQTLNNLLSQRPRPTTVKLCDDISVGNSGITFSTNYSEYHVTLDLNGHNLTANNNATVITVQSNAYLTITGSGTVSGRISADTDRLTLAGGRYARTGNNNDLTRYVKDDSLYAYRVGSGNNREYRVETKLTDGNVTVTPDPIKVRVGGTVTAAMNFPTTPIASTSGATYRMSDTSIATVNSNTGVITGVKVGKTKVTASSTHAVNNNPAVTKEVEVEVLPVLTSVTADDITVQAGKDVTISNIVVADASITPTFTYASNDESVATVDTNTGKVTGKSHGKTTVTITATYTDAVGTMTVSGDINVTVYEITAGAGDDDGVASESLAGLVDGNMPEDPANYSDELKEALGAEYTITGPEIRGTIIAGGVLSTIVDAKTVEPDEVTRVSVENALKAEGIKASSIKYYDARVQVTDGDLPLGDMHKLSKETKVFLAEVENPANGYKRTYYVVKYHNGIPTVLREGEGFVIENNKIYVLSDEFSIFALAYEDTLLPVKYTVTTPETGAYASESGSANASSVVALVAGIVAVVLGGAVVLAKRK